jgi:hypothetical protein
MTMSYCREGSVPSTRASTDSNLEGDLSSASTKLELSILLVGAHDFSVLSRCGFSCIIQLILRDYRVSASRYCLFRLSLLRIVKIVKQLSSFAFSLLVVLFYSINIRGS